MMLCEVKSVTKKVAWSDAIVGDFSTYILIVSLSGLIFLISKYCIRKNVNFPEKYSKFICTAFMRENSWHSPVHMLMRSLLWNGLWFHWNRLSKDSFFFSTKNKCGLHHTRFMLIIEYRRLKHSLK